MLDKGSPSLPLIYEWYELSQMKKFLFLENFQKKLVFTFAVGKGLWKI